MRRAKSKIATPCLRQDISDLAARCEALATSGGVIGPLPDGYVIEVHHLRWDELRELLPARDTPIIREIGDAGQPLIDAYNDAFGD